MVIEKVVLRAIERTALNSMVICRIINGIPLNEYSRCFFGQKGKFVATIPERCRHRENQCNVWSFKVYAKLRSLEKRGLVKSTLLRWFDKKKKGKLSARGLDKFRFWFTHPENLRKRLLNDVEKLKQMNCRVLLVLPCNKYAEVGDYKLGRNWKMVLKRIESWRDRIDLAAIDCINMLGLVPEWENYKTIGHNIYPSWEHFKNNPEQLEELSIAIARKLKELAPRYEQIIAYLNVKAYFLALKRASELSKIKVNFVEIDFNPISYAKNLPKLIETITHSKNGS